MAKKTQTVDAVTEEQLQNILTFDREFNERKDLPAGFTGVVRVSYTEVEDIAGYQRWDYRTRTYVTEPGYTQVRENRQEYWFLGGQYHRTGSKPALRKEYFYTAPPKQVEWKPYVTTEYWLLGKQVTKKSCDAGADKQTSRVLMSLSGTLSFGSDLTVYGVEGVIYGVLVGTDAFVLDVAGRTNRKISKEANWFEVAHEKAMAKPGPELAQMVYDMMMNMSVLG